jgi:hypothetical protein
VGTPPTDAAVEAKPVVGVFAEKSPPRILRLLFPFFPPYPIPLFVVGGGV